MKLPDKLFLISALCLLIFTLLLGIAATFSFLYPESFNSVLPFYQLRPFHVSAAIFWIVTGATACILQFKADAFDSDKRYSFTENLFRAAWLGTIALIFISYGFRKFGGREYWEFPPVLCVPLLISWLMLVVSFFVPLLQSARKQPMYVWMWSTGILFFLITFIEQNLWQVPWFRNSYLREITVQWKANGATVGAWNQMIYGISLYLMVKISGNEKIAKGRTVFFFYMLGLTNLMFNWGHHIYNVPGASWIRTTSYFISMTEWIFLIKMIYGFRKTLEERKKLRHLPSYRFLIAAEFWVFMNLLLTLAMSVPAINRYTHGTHITVAHAMGSTIGINTMILLGAFSYLGKVRKSKTTGWKMINMNYWFTQILLGVFWTLLLIAGVLKGYNTTALNNLNFQAVMKPVLVILKIFSFAGIGLAVSLVVTAGYFIQQIWEIEKVKPGESSVKMSVVFKEEQI